MELKALLTERTRFRNLSRSFSIGLFALLLAAAGVWGASGKWTSNGPPPSWSQGSAAVLAVDSLDPNLVFAGTQDGLYRSRDGGRSWEPIDNGIPLSVLAFPQISVEALVADPSRPGNLYAGFGQSGFLGYSATVGRLHKSFDSGSSWQTVPLTIPGQDPGSPFAVSSIAIDPMDHDVVYASASTMPLNSVPRNLGIFRSADAGASWSFLATPSGLPEVSIAIDPTNSANVYALSLSGDVSRSSDSGVSWTTVGVSSKGLFANVLAIDPFRPSALLVGTASGLFRSLDSGRTFQPLSSMSRSVLALLFDPVRPQHVLVGTDGGLFQSTDGGESFDATPLLAGRIAAVSSAPSSPSTLYAAADGRVWRSDDGGTTWQQGGRQVISRVTALAIDPTRGGHLVASVSPNFFFESQDAGQSWTQIGTTISDLQTALTFDPTNPRTLYVGETSPFPGIPPCSGISKSEDAGRTWKSLQIAPFSPAPGECVSEIAVDSQRGNVVYALRYVPPFPNSIFKSTDAGLTWADLKPPANAFSFVLDPGNPAVLYTATSVGVARSSDGGLTWLVINTTLPLTAGGTILIDGSNPKVLYVLTSDGLFKSVDAGSHWQRIGPGPQILGLNAIVLDPLRSGTLYAGGAGGLVVSQDSGASWEPFEFGLLDTSVSALAIETSGRRLYAGTVTRGVFDYEIPLDRIPLTKPPMPTSSPRKITPR